MKFMVIVRPGNPEGYEQGAMPSQELLSAMGKFNEELVNAGVMLGGEGLMPTGAGAKLEYNEQGVSNFTEGPFTESTEIIGGFWMWNVESRDEAIEWARRAPMESGATLELRQVFELEDFGEENAKHERELMERMAENQR